MHLTADSGDVAALDIRLLSEIEVTAVCLRFGFFF
jgi:hypothetical protein